MFVNLEWRIKYFSFLTVYNSQEKKYDVDLEETCFNYFSQLSLEDWYYTKVTSSFQRWHWVKENTVNFIDYK